MGDMSDYYRELDYQRMVERPFDDQRRIMDSIDVDHDVDLLVEQGVFPPEIVWTTRDGRRLKLGEIPDEHLRNIERAIRFGTAKASPMEAAAIRHMLEHRGLSPKSFGSKAEAVCTAAISALLVAWPDDAKESVRAMKDLVDNWKQLTDEGERVRVREYAKRWAGGDREREAVVRETIGG